MTTFLENIKLISNLNSSSNAVSELEKNLRIKSYEASLNLHQAKYEMDLVDKMIQFVGEVDDPRKCIENTAEKLDEIDCKKLKYIMTISLEQRKHVFGILNNIPILLSNEINSNMQEYLTRTTQLAAKIIREMHDCKKYINDYTQLKEAKDRILSP